MSGAVDAGLFDAADLGLRAALAGRPLVSVERFASSGRTTYAGPSPVRAARPELAIGCYRPWDAAAAARAVTAEDAHRVRGVEQRRTWMDGIDAAARAAVAGLGRPAVLAAWYATDQLRSWAGAGGQVAAIDARLRQVLEGKAHFGQVLERSGVPAALRLPAARVEGRLPGLRELRRLVGAERLVVQCGADSGGRGTVFVDIEDDLARAACMRGPYRVTAFVVGWSSNITVLSVPGEDGTLRVYVDRPSHKAVGVVEAGIGPAKSAGNTWSIPWPEGAAAAVVDAAVRVAHWAWAEHRMRGLFGLDVLLTDDGPYFNELNCRNQGTTEVSAVNQQLRGVPPFLVAHLTTLLGGRIDWLPEPDDFNAATIQCATSPDAGPYYLKLRHRGEHPVVLDDRLHGPGIYRPAGGSLRWVGSGAHPGDAGLGHVLLANLPAPGVVCLPGAEFGTAEAVTTADGAPFEGPHTLSPTGRALLAAFDQHLVPTDYPK